MNRHAPVGNGGAGKDVSRSGRCSCAKVEGGGSLWVLYMRARVCKFSALGWIGWSADSRIGPSKTSCQMTLRALKYW